MSSSLGSSGQTWVFCFSEPCQTVLCALLVFFCVFLIPSQGYFGYFFRMEEMAVWVCGDQLKPRPPQWERRLVEKFEYGCIPRRMHTTLIVPLPTESVFRTAQESQKCMGGGWGSATLTSSRWREWVGGLTTPLGLAKFVGVDRSFLGFWVDGRVGRPLRRSCCFCAASPHASFMHAHTLPLFTLTFYCRVPCPPPNGHK